MAALNTLEDLLLDQIKDLHSAETQILDALPNAINASTNEDLRQALQSHLEETKGHISRLEKAFSALDQSVSSEHCHGMEGLVKEAEKDIGELGDPLVKDAAIIASAQRIEHYEIAGYGTAARLAKEIGRKDVAGILHETLEEEKAADEKLTKVATGGWMSAGVNQAAARS